MPVTLPIVLILAFATHVWADVNQKPCTAEPNPTELSYGDLANCSIDSGTDSDLFRFSGQAGDYIEVYLYKYQLPGQGCFRLIQPNGAIGTLMCTSNFSVHSMVVQPVRLTVSGTYTIQVTEGNNQTMPYGVALFRLLPYPSEARPLEVYGGILSGAITPRGDTDFYTFVGRSGDTISINATKLTQPASICFRVIDPDETIGAATCSPNFSVDSTAQTTFALTKTGTFAVQIWDGLFDETFSYNLEIQCLAGICPAQPPPPARPEKLRFVPLTPCRLMETREQYNFEGRTGPFGPPFLKSGETRTLVLPKSTICQIPPTAKTYVANITLVPRPQGIADFVTIYPAYEPRPDVWSVRSPDGQIVANSSIVKAVNGAIEVYTSHDADILIDISGYFTDAVEGNANNLVFYPLTPCRVIETRSLYRASGPFGPPTMESQETRRFRFPASPHCGIPVAAAYSVTITAVPPQPLAFLTAWAGEGPQPNVSSLNSFAGRILANSVILPPSADGSLDVFVFNRTDLIIDINGYFAPDDGANGSYYYPVTPRRVFNSQNVNGPCGGPLFADETKRTIPINTCAGSPAPTSAKAFHITATALPNSSPMPFLTAWSTGQLMPNASFLNAFEGQIVSNSVIVPAGTNGSIDLYAFRRTNVVIDFNGYFGR